MESVNRKIVLLAILLAAVTSLLVFMYVRNATTNPEVVEYIQVYVAARTLPAKYIIQDADLKQANVAKESLNPKALINKADIVGKRLKDSVIEGEQILKERLLDESSLNLAYTLEKGMRAVSITVNEVVNVSNMVRPGDFVDIIASFAEEQVEDMTTRTIYPKTTKIILQKVLILAMGQAQDIQTETVQDAPRTVTLAVSPADAEKLVFISENATLRFALRPAEDEDVVKTEGSIRSDFQSTKGVRIMPK